MKMFDKITTHDHCRMQVFKRQYYFIHLILKFYKTYIKYKIFNRDKLEKRMNQKRKQHYIDYPELYNGRSIINNNK